MPLSSALQPPAGFAGADARAFRSGSLEKVACTQCGQLHAMTAGSVGLAVCVRCGATLDNPGTVHFTVPFAFGLGALLLFPIAVFAPLLTIRSYGDVHVASLVAAGFAFGQHGYWVLGLWVVVLSVVAPLIWLAALAYVLGSLTFERAVPGLCQVLRVAQGLREWAMADVFLFGAIVAYSRLRDMAEVRLGVGLYALVGCVGLILAMDEAFDLRATWRAVASAPPPDVPSDAAWCACLTCGFVHSFPGGEACPGRCRRCGAILRHRKPDSVGRSWAFVAAGILLYIPANILPVMRIDWINYSQTNTILGGVEALIANRMWPLAIVVFLASIVVPVVKLVGLAVLLISVQKKWRKGLPGRAHFFRVIERIGRWSNIDVFAVSLLTALIQFGNFTRVSPGPGIVPFALVVVLTMIATRTFDPRLMWDAAGGGNAE